MYHETQPVAGDRAIAVREGDAMVIQGILPRENVLQRTAPLGRTTQTIASNVDIVLAVCSFRRPDFSHGFLSRALVASEWRKLSASVVLNKIDLCRGENDESLLSEIQSVYGNAGYPVFPVSCRTGAGTASLLEHIRGDTVVMTGPSGAGKTSLAKRYIPSLDVRIGSVNPKTSKGRHTTVAARMIPLEGDTFLIDTPGLKMFSIEHVPCREIQWCFPEFRQYLGTCRFSDCMHVSEPGCTVKDAVEKGIIPSVRYGLYVDFVNETG